MPTTLPPASADRRRSWRAYLLVCFATIGCIAALGFLNERGRLHEIAIENMTYAPAELEVNVGDRVRFTNRDVTPHTVTNADFDSGTILAGRSWTLSVAKPGQAAYRCIYHPTMTGSLRVGVRN